MTVKMFHTNEWAKSIGELKQEAAARSAEGSSIIIVCALEDEKSAEFDVYIVHTEKAGKEGFDELWLVSSDEAMKELMYDIANGVAKNCLEER